ncbi:MAG: GNAT family N-acetyltransferase [Chloroflexi bacterium]|nr:GNAT family N-acetyltransferase [Chloroflexota bacterium]MDA1002169.1 GNAT family N-acetyltransferase [Chloroflexota bacterium]
MTDAPPLVRPALRTDLESLNAIYNWEVEHGIATWELDPWPLARRVEWFSARDHEEPVLVAEREGKLVGFAYLTKYRGRRGYRFTRENTVFVAPAQQRRGVGRVLLAALLVEARTLGLHSVLAFIDEENVGSIELHAALGYVRVGAERETGYKFDRWRSSVEMQLML